MSYTVHSVVQCSKAPGVEILVGGVTREFIVGVVKGPHERIFLRNLASGSTHSSEPPTGFDNISFIACSAAGAICMSRSDGFGDWDQKRDPARYAITMLTPGGNSHMLVDLQDGTRCHPVAMNGDGVVLASWIGRGDDFVTPVTFRLGATEPHPIAIDDDVTSALLPACRHFNSSISRLSPCPRTIDNSGRVVLSVQLNERTYVPLLAEPGHPARFLFGPKWNQHLLSVPDMSGNGRGDLIFRCYKGAGDTGSVRRSVIVEGLHRVHPLFDYAVENWRDFNPILRVIGLTSTGVAFFEESVDPRRPTCAAWAKNGDGAYHRFQDEILSAVGGVHAVGDDGSVVVSSADAEERKLEFLVLRPN